MSRNFYLRTCVKFTFANKMEAMHERSLVSVKVEPHLTSRLSSALFILPLFYLHDWNLRALTCVAKNASVVHCKTVGFFLKTSKEIGKAWRKGLSREARKQAYEAREKNAFSVSPQSRSHFSVSFQTFCLTDRAYLNKQKYGLFCKSTFTLML